MPMNNPSQSPPSHNQAISIVKGIGIALMVIGHAGIPEALRHWIYSFHMPLFFFVSGFLFKDSYLINAGSSLRFARNKMRGLYLPFVLWVSFFALLHNALAYIHVYPDFFSRQEIASRVKDSLRFVYSDELVSGYWFLIALFFSSFLSFAILFLLSRIKQIWRSTATRCCALFFSSMLMAGGAFLCSVFQGPFHGWKTYFFGSAFMLAGQAYRQMQWRPGWKWASALLLLSLGVSFAIERDLSMSVEGADIFMVFFLALVGIAAIVEGSNYIKGKLAYSLDRLGQHTLAILTFHLSAFKIVSVLIIFFCGFEIERLAESPILSDAVGFECIFYAAAGIAFPILLSKSIPFFKHHFFRSSKKICDN